MLDPTSAALVLAGGSPIQPRSYLTASDILKGQLSVPARVYLGGCEGAGFDTGAEWGSVASALIAKGASTVIAHSWPVLDTPAANTVDHACVAALRTPGDEALAALSRQQLFWLSDWRAGVPNAIPPYYWSGLQYIGSAM